MPHWYLDVDNHDNALEGDAPAPGDRSCSLWGPRGPCQPSVEGTADEWLELAQAIAERRPLAFKRAAFTPTEAGGDFHSPRNAASERPSATLTAAELDGLVRSIRDQLAPPAGPTPTPGSRPPGVPTDATHVLAIDPKTPPTVTPVADGLSVGYQAEEVPLHPMAEDGSGPTTGAPTLEPATSDGILAAFAEMAPPAGRAPDLPTSAPAEDSLVGAMRDARAELAARGIKVDAAAWLAEDGIDDEDDGEPATYSDEDDEPACPDCHEPALLGHTADCGIAAEILAAQCRDDAADAIVRVLDRGFLPHLRAAIDRASPGDLLAMTFLDVDGERVGRDDVRAMRANLAALAGKGGAG